MRKILLAGLALTSLAAAEARAAAPDTSRAPVPAGAARVEPSAYAGAADGSIAIDLDAFAAPGADFQDGYREGNHDRGGQYAPRVRVWLDNDRDILRPSDRTRVLVRATEDSYLAVIHIDTNGDVEFLYPSSPHDDGYVQGGRTYSVPARGSGYLSVRGGYGIGYVFAIASSEPLDYDRYRDSWYRSARWDRDRNVYGDPFHAMERFERSLVRDYDYGYHDSDHYSYHVGRRYSYPRYACYDGYGPWYSSRTAYWGTCDRVRVLLIGVPYYYDTRYYRGDRRVYYRRYYPEYYANRRDPEHGYKDGGRAAAAPPLRRRGSEDVGNRLGRDQEGQQERRAQQPERTRPVFGRRVTEASEPAGRRTSAEEPRGRRAEPTERRVSPPAERRAEPRAEPQRSDPPARRAEPPAERRSEPRRAEPRAEPRRAEPRSERRSEPRAEPRRESAPAPRASRSSGGSSRRP